jgi:hypothetical protein
VDGDNVASELGDADGDEGELYRDIGADVALVAIGMLSWSEVFEDEDEDEGSFEVFESPILPICTAPIVPEMPVKLSRQERDQPDGSVSLHCDSCP